VRSSPPLCFGTLTSHHRTNRGLPLLARHWINRSEIGHQRTHKTTAAVVSSAEPSIRKAVEMTIDSRVMLESRHGAGYEEAADITDSFVGRSVGGGKRTTAALASKRTLVNDNGSVNYTLRTVG